MCWYVGWGWPFATSCEEMVLLDGGWCVVFFFPWMINLPVGKTKGLLCNILAFSSSLLSFLPPSSLLFLLPAPLLQSCPLPETGDGVESRWDESDRTHRLRVTYRSGPCVRRHVPSAFIYFCNHCGLKVAVEQRRKIQLRRQPAGGVGLCWCLQM